MLFRTSASVIALVACTSLAAAADLGGPSYGGSLKDDLPAPAAAHNWAGPYIGLHAGYGWGEWDGKFYDYNSAADGEWEPYTKEGEHIGNSVDLDGFLAGAQLGYNVQSGNFVFGIEGDIAWSDINGSETWQTKWNDKTTEWNLDTDINWLATLRARAGFTRGSALFFVTGGLAIADVDSSYSLNGGDWSGKASDTMTGWTVGGGVELALAQNWSVKAEYLYIDLGDMDVTLDDENCWKPENFDGDINLHTFRIGFNYKFGDYSYAAPLK